MAALTSSRILFRFFAGSPLHKKGSRRGMARRDGLIFRKVNEQEPYKRKRPGFLLAFAVTIVSCRIA
ncbi:MAG: hypothetical protein E4H32_07070 [Nitrospirales bacterium]|nr:MAG: hypothetical protein E4H32_07070 [Nitrospirales bacterium]